MNEEEILDDDSILKNENEFHPKLLNWATVIILWFGIGYSILNGLIIDIQVIAAFILLATATIISFVNFNLGVKITLAVILVGTFNLVNFFPQNYNLLFGINSFEFGFECYLLGIGIIHYFTNRDQLSTFLKDLINRDVTEEEIEADNRMKIDRFKRRFSNKNISELRKIASNENLVPEAKKAGKELLEEKIKN